jgi:hypothetical protein
VLREDPPLTPVASVNTFLTGLHLQHFRHWLLRWLYVLGGLSGCVCIATGFIFFVEKRKRQHAKQGRSGARWVDAFAVSTVTGMLVAALAMLIGQPPAADRPAGARATGSSTSSGARGCWPLRTASGERLAWRRRAWRRHGPSSAGPWPPWPWPRCC